MLDELLAASPSLTSALAGLERAAAADVPILVLGEPATGRSRVARAIHQLSDRRGGPLVEVDPGVVPATLFESELFGHRAGAFTGATESVAGRVDRAEGGTLVLDHVEELPLTAQPKLLRLLAERTYAPLGGDEQQTNVRFVALGSADLPTRVESGAFRADLYYRLGVFVYVLPPLRERLADLPSLCAALLTDLAGRLGRPRPRLAAAALDWMQRHHWPGNLRELRNTLERALIVSGGDEVNPAPPVASQPHVPRSLAAVEREQILVALAHTRGHQGRAAEILGISRKALWQKRKRHGIR
ncbi:MAG: sigma-54 dependent transcriptional regulator [Acidobacteriota bacterium]